LAQLGATWRNLAQHGAQHGATWRNMAQLGATWRATWRNFPQLPAISKLQLLEVCWKLLVGAGSCCWHLDSITNNFQRSST